MKTNKHYEAELQRLIDDLYHNGVAVFPMELLYKFYEAERLGKAIYRDFVRRITDVIGDTTARIRVYKADWAKLAVCVDSLDSTSDWDIWSPLEDLIGTTDATEEKDDTAAPTQSKLKARTFRY